MTSAILAIWLAAICFVAVFKPQRLLAVAIVCAVFDAASLLKVGGFAITPYYFTLVLIAARCAFITTDARHALGSTQRVRAIMIAVLVFAGIALTGAVALPHVFAGWPVYSPRLDDSSTAPLSISASNLGQGVYLILNVALLWYVAQNANSEIIRSDATNAVLFAGAVVIGFAFYQLLASATGLPYPDDILYSNDTYVSQYGTIVLDMPRICSTFTEPAGMAVFLLGFTAFLSSDARGITRSPVLRWTLLIGAVVVLILSTSSTAYVGLAVIMVWRIGTFIVLPIVRGSWSGKRVGAMLFVLVAIAVMFVASPTMREMIQTAVLDKDESSSFDERSQGDKLSTGLISSTYGLGVGLGSTRASSFVPSLLSTVGVLGAGAFAVMLVLAIRKSESSALLPGRHLELASGVLGILCAKAIAQPDLSSPGLWAFLAGLVAIHGTPRRSVATSAALVNPMSSFRGFRAVSLTRPN